MRAMSREFNYQLAKPGVTIQSLVSPSYVFCVVFLSFSFCLFVHIERIVPL